MSFFNTDGNGVKTAAVAPTEDASLAIDTNFHVLSTALGNNNVRLTYDGGGAPISTGNKVYSVVSKAGTITGYTLLADQSGSIVIAIKKCAYAGFPTTASITGAGTPPTLSSAQKAQDTSLTSWSTSLAANDILEFSVTSASTVTRVQLFLTIAGA